MASTIILSDNGVSSGSAGLKETAGNDGVLILQTTTSGGTATNAVYVDTSQNVGLGTTPTEKLTINGNIKLGTSGTAWTYGPSTSGRSFFSNSDSTAYVGVYGSAYGSSVDAVVQLTAGTTSTAILNATGSFSLAGATRTANGVGITFPATQSASSDANTLDDYEEGNWTPVIGGNDGTSGQSYGAANWGRYTKIGNLVTLNFQVVLTAKGTMSGSYSQIQGFPFTSASQGGSSGSFSYYANLSTGQYWCGFYIDPGATAAYITGNTTSTTNIGYLAPAAIGNSTVFIGTITFRTN